MKPALPWLALVLAALPIASPATFASAGYVTASWHTTDGLPSEKVHAILQSRTGYLWVATRNGLARFDGVRFQAFANDPEGTLQNNFPHRLHEDRSGALWIGSETGRISVLADDRFISLPSIEGWPSQPIERIAEARDGTLWALSRTGVLCGLRDRRPFTLLHAENNARIFDVVTDVEGLSWAVVGGTLQRLAGATLRHDESCPPDTLDRPRITAARQGGLWVAEGGRLRRWHRGRWAEERAGIEVAATIRAMIETREGLVLIGTFDHGLQIVPRSGPLIQIDRTQGLPENWIQTLWEDLEGNLWLGTGGKGLWRLRARNVTMIEAPDNWLDSAVLSVTPRSGGGVWVGTEGPGLYRVQGADIERFTLRGRTTVVRALLEESPDLLRAGLSGANVQTFHGRDFTTLLRKEETSPAFALHRATDGRLWIGTANGYAVSGPGAEYAFHDLRASVRSIVPTDDGTLWLGTLGRGALRIRGDEFRFFDTRDGLPGNDIWSLSADHDGTVWIGTHGRGLARIRNDRCSVLSTRQGLPGDVVSHIQDDGAGHLWIGSNGGIFRVSKDELHEAFDGLRPRLTCLILDASDGLTSLEMTGGSQPTGCRTPDGRLWFATAGGLAMVDPTLIRTNRLPPPVRIEELRVEGRPPWEPAGRALEIAPGATQVQIDYTALSFTAPDRVRFRYRLEGRDAGWTEAGQRRTAYYSYLPPGDYVFRVTACNNDGLWNETGAVLAFRLRPYFWQTGWFRAFSVALGALAVAALVFALARRRHRRRLTEWKRREAIAAERTRIARDIHDDLGAGLTQLSLLAHSARRLLPDPARASERIEEIQSSVRGMTQAMDEIVWAVNPRNDTLDSLVNYLGAFAQDFLRSGGVRCRLDLPLELPPRPLSAEARHCLYLATRETLNNVLKHAAATTVTVSAQIEPDAVTLVVTDDGVGLEGSATGRASFLRAGSGSGLDGLRQRLTAAGGTLEIAPAPGRGTVVRLRIQTPPS